MHFLYRRDQFLLFLGDIVVFTVSLWLALLARHFEMPTVVEFWTHVLPFSFLFVCWILVFVTVGLYDRSVALFEHRLPTTITEAQVVNMALAVLFFFLAPIAIQPKTVLALYFVISTSLVVVWRLGLFRYRSAASECEVALVVGSGPDMAELIEEIRRTPRTRLECASVIDTAGKNETDLKSEIKAVRMMGATTQVVADPRVLHLFEQSDDCINASDLYEALFSRVPLSMLNRKEFLRTALSRESRLYDVLKRAMDIVLSLVLGVVSLALYPFVWLAIAISDGGALFVSQERVGKGGAAFRMSKFRSMSGNDDGKYGAEGKTKLHVTPVGAVLRKSRIDELPQLWSVLLGDQSLVGPRPELPALVAEYQKNIPNYDLRHLVLPGLSGWAQIYHQAHPHNQVDVEETARKLSYDLYYIKHRSLVLDLDIALKTIKALSLRLGA